MKTRREQREEKRERNRKQAEAEYADTRQTILHKIAGITLLVKKHQPKGVKADPITFAHVGDLKHVAAQLDEVEQFLKGYPNEQ